MSVGILTISMFLLLGVVLITGLPMAFSLSAVAILFTYFLWGANSLFLITSKIYGIWNTVVLVAVPLFIMMGCVLERSGIAEDLYAWMHGVIGRLRGGLSVGTVIICTIFAAMTGISGAATVTMGVVALPQMLKRGYDKQLAIGCIAAGGALGILIPPSIVMIVFALFAEESVGRLFAGGILPGILLSSIFITYILVRSYMQPQIAPPVGADQAYSLKKTMYASRSLAMPLLLVAAVLGSIFSGAATPTEAAAVGAFGSIVCAIIRGKFSFGRFKEAIYETLRVSSIVLWIYLGAALFTSVYIAMGAQELIKDMLTGLPVNRWLVLIMMQLSLFVLGCFMSVLGIVMITTPVYVPVIIALDFNVVWYGILFVMNMEMAYLTPPFGVNLFYLRGVVPPGITMMDIYRSIIPFVILQGIGLAIVMIYPKIALFLPDLIFKR